MKITPISGFPEYLPAQRIIEQHFLDVIRETFELHGFASIETRAVEPVDRLLGKGGDADKEIYGVTRLADDVRGRSDSDAELGLHFDLTVPFARYVLENAGHLAFPFRRYQIQKVWRGERPQEGRYREFTQADIDVVDVGELRAALRGRDAAGHRRGRSASCRSAGWSIQVNNRKIPEGFYLGIGIDGRRPAPCASSTSSTRSARTRSRTCSSRRAATPEQADQCLALAAIRTDGPVLRRAGARARRRSTRPSTRASTPLAAVIQAGIDNAPGALVADLKIARGLDYYTGTVYETQLVGFESWGSFCSGGRYDSLASRRQDHLSRRRHLDRRLAPARAAHRQGAAHGSAGRRPPCVLVAVNDEESRAGSTPRRRRRCGPRHPVRGGARAREVRQADPVRRAARHPVRLVPGRGRRATATRSRTSAPATRSTRTPTSWEPPAEDLRPQIIRAES